MQTAVAEIRLFNHCKKFLLPGTPRLKMKIHCYNLFLACNLPAKVFPQAKIDHGIANDAGWNEGGKYGHFLLCTFPMMKCGPCIAFQWSIKHM